MALRSSFSRWIALSIALLFTVTLSVEGNERWSTKLDGRINFYQPTEFNGRRGLVGVNVNNGNSDRFVRLANPDERFVRDEQARLLYTSDGNRLLAYRLDARE
ncbi:MAG TPA: hypothetical protein VJ023_04670 [Pyrinomonadaceae bacterium]|nr:hypothetical protein [Pyrinomonadaceae bacterium]